MCGRYTLTTEADDLLEVFSVPELLFDHRPRFNIAPTQDVPAVASDGEERRMGLLRWGLVPRWADDLSIGSRLINARSETVHEKPAFRDAFAKRRCLLPADGFYEWKKEGDEKTPYWIHREERAPFAFAGIWERWESPDGEQVHSCSILTRQAAPELAPLHSRMPVILDEEESAVWLAPATVRDELRDLLDEHAPPSLVYHAVSRAVNSPRNDSPDCIEPADLAED